MIASIHRQSSATLESAKGTLLNIKDTSSEMKKAGVYIKLFLNFSLVNLEAAGGPV